MSVRFCNIMESKKKTRLNFIKITTQPQQTSSVYLLEEKILHLMWERLTVSTKVIYLNCCVIFYIPFLFIAPTEPKRSVLWIFSASLFMRRKIWVAMSYHTIWAFTFVCFPFLLHHPIQHWNKEMPAEMKMPNNLHQRKF